MLRHPGSFFTILTLVIFTIAAPVAAEMITGTVLAIDREQGLFTLRTETRQEIQVRTSTSRLPGRLIPGRQVRVWGEYTADHQNFTATDIRGAGKKHHHDQTGVRARIGNGKYCLKSGDETLRKNCSRHREKEIHRDAGNAE